MAHPDAAVAFGRTAADSNDIYVVNNGGAFLNLPGGPEAASIVRIDVGIRGVVPEQQVVPEPSSLGLSCTGAIGLAFVFLGNEEGMYPLGVVPSAPGLYPPDSVQFLHLSV